MKNARRIAVIRKPCIPATLRQIAVGESATFTCRTLGAYGSVMVAISRLNRAAGCQAYDIDTPDNGATYTITRMR